VAGEQEDRRSQENNKRSGDQEIKRTARNKSSRVQEIKRAGKSS
jgi:hypothetical protein